MGTQKEALYKLSEYVEMVKKKIKEDLRANEENKNLNKHFQLKRVEAGLKSCPPDN